MTELGNYIYTFAVHRYVDITGGFSDNPISDDDSDNTSSNGIPKIPLKDSKATVSVYVSGFKGAVHVLSVPTQLSAAGDPDSFNWWTAFCLDGKAGISSLSTVNELTVQKPAYTRCEDYYKNKAATATTLIQKTMNITPAMLEKSRVGDKFH
jgi:hypothetical protein